MTWGQLKKKMKAMKVADKQEITVAVDFRSSLLDEVYFANESEEVGPRGPRVILRG